MKKLLCLLPAVFIFTSCQKKSADSASSDSGAIQDVPVQVQPGESDPIASLDAKRGGSYVTWGGPFPKSLNAWLDNNSFSGDISSLMFETLVEMHSTNDDPIGVLAKSWEISPDGKSYTFHIDPAAKWSDGQPVTAEDVQFFYDVIMNPKNLTSLYRVDLSRFARPEIVDAQTVRITAQEPHWKNFWAAAGFAAFPKHVWKDVDFNKQNFEFPVVSGPYMLGEIKMNRSIELKRRGDWWGRAKQYNVGKFNFDHILYRSIEDRDKVLEVFKKGEIDVYPIYTASMWALKTDFPALQKNWVIKQRVFNQEPRSFQGFAINMRRPILSDVKVRQALAYLINRELMNEKLMFNQYFLLNSYYPDLYPNNQNPAVPIVKFDPEKARSLLKEAGWQVGSDGILAKDGQPLSLSFLLNEGGDMRHLNIYLQDLKAVGISVKIDQVSMSTFTKRMDNHDFDLTWANWGASRLRDPETMWSSKTADEIATQNYCGVKDPEIDRLIELQKTEMSAEKRNAILKQIDDRLMATCPYVLLWQSGSARILYWNKFGTPKYVLPKYGNESSALAYWWYDEAKAAALAKAQKDNTALPPEPAEVHYQE
jgi:microcin C transport system substrate-binding protein